MKVRQVIVETDHVRLQVGPSGVFLRVHVEGRQPDQEVNAPMESGLTEEILDVFRLVEAAREGLRAQRPPY